MAKVRGPLYSQEAWGTLGKSVTYHRQWYRGRAAGKRVDESKRGHQRIATGFGIVKRYQPRPGNITLLTGTPPPGSAAGAGGNTNAMLTRFERNRILFRFVSAQVARLGLHFLEPQNERAAQTMPGAFFGRYNMPIERVTVAWLRRPTRIDINTAVRYRRVTSYQGFLFRRLAGVNYGFLWWLSHRWMRLSTAGKLSWLSFANQGLVPPITPPEQPFGFDWGAGFQQAWITQALLPMTDQAPRGGRGPLNYSRGNIDYIVAGGQLGWTFTNDRVWTPPFDDQSHYDNQFTLAYQFPR